MKKCIYLVSIILIFGCKTNSLLDTQLDNNLGEFSFEEEKTIAELFISENSEDFISTEINDYKIWYNPLVEGPAYIEFKLDQGYIFVSLSDKDIIIPQYGSGEPISDRLLSGCEDQDVILYKLSNTEFVSTKNNIIISKYNLQNNKVDFSSDLLGRMAKGASDHIIFSDYYNYMVSNNPGAISVKASLLNELKRNSGMRSLFSDKSSYSSSLSNYLTCLPNYSQYGKAYGKGGKDKEFYYSGCTPTAFAMVLGYWQLFHGLKIFATNPDLVLNPYANPLDKNITDVVEGLRDHLGTSNGSSGGSTDTYPWVLDNVKDYLKTKGYSKTYLDVNIFTDFLHTDWTRIYQEIGSNRPVVLNYQCDNNNKNSGHSVVIYKVKITRNWLGIYKNIYYNVYLGWGSGSTDYVSAGSHNFYSTVMMRVQ